MEPAIVTIPCFSGAPWTLEELTPLAHRALRTMRLPDDIDSIDRYADYVVDEVEGLDRFVLVGDSFGAVVALAIATRRPIALDALVLSGGFAANPVASPIGRMKINASHFLPGALYREVTLRLHAAALSSPFDHEGDHPMNAADFRQLFLDNTPWKAYVNRAKAAFGVDVRAKLADVSVPTLILTPEHDTLIGEDAARIMQEAIPDARQVVLPRTGHMFRFTHPVAYAGAVESFIAEHIDSTQAA